MLKQHSACFALFAHVLNTKIFSKKCQNSCCVFVNAAMTIIFCHIIVTLHQRPCQNATRVVMSATALSQDHLEMLTEAQSFANNSKRKLFFNSRKSSFFVQTCLFMLCILWIFLAIVAFLSAAHWRNTNQENKHEIVRNREKLINSLIFKQ